MTNDPIEATGELLGRARDRPRRIRPISVGNVNGRHFLFHVGVGFDAAVVAQVEKRSALKRYLGHGFFAYAAFDTWARHYDRRHPHFSVELHRRDGSDGRGRRRLFRHLPEDQPLHLPRRPALRRGPRHRARHPAQRRRAAARSGAANLLGLDGAGAYGAAKGSPAAARSPWSTTWCGP